MALVNALIVPLTVGMAIGKVVEVSQMEKPSKPRRSMSTWVPVLVRLEDYREVAALVAEREADRLDGEPIDNVYKVQELGVLAAGAHPRTSEDRRLADHTPWDVDDLRVLAEGRTKTTERWGRAMDVCAEEPERWLPTSEVARRAGMTINEWRDAPRKITRHLRAHYPNVPVDENGEQVWPLCPGGAGIPANGGEVWWAITREMAARWREVRSG